MKVFELNDFGTEHLTIVEREVAEPQTNDVTVKFHAASLNYRDVMIVKGTYNPRMKFPVVPLSDGAGEITAIGSGVTKWKVGDRVMPIFVQQWHDGDSTLENSRTALGAGPYWPGVLREYGNFNEENLVKIPDHLSFEEAATLPCAALTAWNALHVSGNIKEGDSVLTLGSGGVSVFALQFAKAAGATVIATSGSNEKLERLKKLGADEGINYRDREDWDKAVLELTNGKGVDHVVEVGGEGTLKRSLNAVRYSGHIALIGALSGKGDHDLVPLFMKSVKLQGIFTGSRSMLEDMTAYLENNKLYPVIDEVFDFADATKAIDHMASGKHFGKIIVKIA